MGMKHSFCFNMKMNQEYEKVKKKYDKMIDDINRYFLEEYKKRFPHHYISYHYITDFLHKLSNITLLPDIEDYILLNNQNEFFEVDISILFDKTQNDMILQIPYPINIHKVTEYIKTNNISPRLFNVSDLKKIINPECFNEFDDHIIAKQQGRDLLDKIKKDNPVIVLFSGGVIRYPYLINGTHRTIQAIREKRNTIEAYAVYGNVCQTCGMSIGFQHLYEMMNFIYRKIYGVNKVNR